MSEDKPTIEEQPTFAELGVREETVRALADAGIERTFPIQAQTLPLALGGADLIGQAKTGTGKTLGFSVPIVQGLIAPGESDEPQVRPQALIVVPTRELAIQVAKDIEQAGSLRNVRVLTIYGGRAYEPQIEALTKGIARKHGYAATFMAKPFADDAGNGMHVHFSVVDQDGNNVFDNGGPEGTDVMRHAVGGCVAAMPPSTLVFVPHGVSYNRMVPGAHAPTGAGWAYENRTAAIRIPGGSHKARRIEHRVACGDINPYLILASILGAAMVGIEDKLDPGEPLTGNAYEIELPQLAGDWASAIDLFEKSEINRRIFPDLLIENLCNTKRQELQRLADVPADELWKIYIDAA